MTERQPKWAGNGFDRGEHFPTCDRCEAFARWSILRCEGDTDSRGNLQFIVRWFACGRHLNQILETEEWWLDAVQIYDLTQPPERS